MTKSNSWYVKLHKEVLPPYTTYHQAGYYIGSVNDHIGFLVCLLHGELDREAISEETVKNYGNKCDNDLYREAEAHSKSSKLLHAVLTKP